MSIRTFLTTAALAASFIASPAHDAAAAVEHAPHSSFCMFASLPVTQVASLYKDARTGRGAVRQFAGAQVFVPAQPGLTPEWIRANIARHMAEAKAHPSYDCPLDVAGSTVSVSSGGTGFWVQISATDSDAAHEILNRARKLVR